MLRFLLLSLFLPISIILQAQDDYKQYLDLSYAEIDSISNDYYKKGLYKKIVPFALAGIEKAETDFGEDSTLIDYLGWGGFALSKAGEYRKALPLMIRSKNITEKLFGKNHEQYGLVLINLGSIYQNLDEYDKAIGFYTQSKIVWEKALGENHPKVAYSLNNLAAVYTKIGDHDKILDCLIQAKDIREKTIGTEHIDFAHTLRDIAHTYQTTGNHEKALPLIIQATQIYRTKLGAKHPKLSSVLRTMARYYEETGDYKNALKIYLEANGIIEATVGKGSLKYADNLTAMAIVYQKMKEYDKALPLINESTLLYKKILGEETVGFATVSNNIATQYSLMKNYEEAEQLFKQAIAIRENKNATDHPYYNNYLNNLSNNYIKTSKFSAAWSTLLKSIKHSSNLEMSSNINSEWADSLLQVRYSSDKYLEKTITSLKYITILLSKDSSVTESIKKQIIVTDLVLDLLEKQNSSYSNDKDKLRILSKINEWIGRNLELLSPVDDSHKAFALADKNKSVLLLQSNKSEEYYRLGDLPDSLVWRDKELLKTYNKLDAQLLEKRLDREKDSLRTELINVTQEIDDFVKYIKAEYPKYHKLKYQQVQIKVEDIQALLDEQTALIEYVVLDSTVHIFRVDKKSVLWHQEAIVDSILIEKVEQLHQSLSDYSQISKEKEQNFATYTELAHWFYQKLIEPILQENEDVENLIFVTDGELGHLPFEAFLVEAVNDNNYKNLHYLLKDYNISYNYSARLWQENKTARKQKNNGQMLSMAAHYSKSVDSSLVRGRLPTTRWMRDALSPLPAAREEVEALAKQFKGYFAFDSLATERVLQEKAGEYAVIHLAMHGLLDEKRPVLSALALTEDGDSLYDNFWQAHEISKMELNADLVVLSACETGYGRFETGNGIASLARSFMYAGVPSLVVSLWQVNDASTSAIMQNFYAHLAAGKTKSAALRQAKLDYIEQADGFAAHPAFWSPFILIGDESPIKLQQKGAGSWVWWGVGAGALLLAGLGFGLARRKKAA